MQERIPSNIILQSIYPKSHQDISDYMSSLKAEIFSYIINNLPQNENENLEIEARIGKIRFEGSSIKAFNFIRQIFLVQVPFDKDFRYKFEPGVSPKVFYAIYNALDLESKHEYKENFLKLQKNNPIIYKEKHYNTGKRYQEIFEGGKKTGEECIIKEKKVFLNVRNCGNDFRISCCKERKTDIDKDRDKEELKRNKFRICFTKCFYEVDLTVTNDSKTNFNEYSYEVELELNMKKVLEMFPLHKKKDDFTVNGVYSVIDRFIQNIFTFLYLVKYEGYENHYSKKGEGISLFGNYLKDNDIL